jgi:hypothetical protein
MRGGGRMRGTGGKHHLQAPETAATEGDTAAGMTRGTGAGKGIGRGSETGGDGQRPALQMTGEGMVAEMVVPLLTALAKGVMMTGAETSAAMTLVAGIAGGTTP